MSKKSVFGLDENLAGALCYAIPLCSGIVFLVLERENKFVRFHALQAVVTYGALIILGFAVGLVAWLPMIGWLLKSIANLIFLAAWLYLTYTAYKGLTFKVPIIGDSVWEQVNK